MSGWGEVLNEIRRNEVAGQKHANTAAEQIRKAYLAKLQDFTGRNVIVYASAWQQKGGLPPEYLSVHPSDLDGFMEVVKACDCDKPLDLILHSPGGSGEAAEQIVNYLRSKFSSIRAIVPTRAMSAATMMACGADSIMLGRHSALGPTDPQVTFRNQSGQYVSASAHAIRQDFENAKSATRDEFPAWATIISQYWPGLLTECDRATQRSCRVVEDWLHSYMLKGKRGAKKKAKKISEYLAELGEQQHHSHGRPLMRELLRDQGLEIENLEDDQALQDLVLSVYHATIHTLGGTTCTKVIECSAGAGYFMRLRAEEK